MASSIIAGKPAKGKPLPVMSDALGASIGVVEVKPMSLSSAGGKAATGHVQVEEIEPSSDEKVKQFQPAVKPSAFVKAQLQISAYAARYQQCIAHARTWALTRLQEYYPHEYNSLRSRKQQAKARHIAFDERLADLRDWLVHLGPRPASGWTVHRINNYKGYQPGNLKWATKTEQTQIRKVTKWHDVNGKLMTIKQLAKHLGITYTCLYKRLQHGWTIERLLVGQKKVGGIIGWQFPPEVAHVLEPLYAQRKSYPQSRIDWFIAYMKKRLQQIGSLAIQGVSEDELVLLQNLLDTAEKELAAILKEQRRQDELEMRMMIAALSPPKQFTVFHASPPKSSVDSPQAHTSAPVACSTPTATVEQHSLPDYAKAYELDQQRRLANVEYLAGIVAFNCPDSLFGTPWTGGQVFDDIYQRFADEAYLAVEGHGQDAVTNLLHVYQERGIPMPRSELLHAGLPA